MSERCVICRMPILLPEQDKRNICTVCEQIHNNIVKSYEKEAEQIKKEDKDTNK